MDDLHQFGAGGNKTGLTELLRHSPSLVSVRGEHGFTPLHYAAVEGHVDIAELLLSYSADINSQDAFGRTPLLLSIYEEPLILDRTPIVEFLISKGAEVDLADDKGWTPLFMAALCGEADCVELLLTAAADVNVRNAEGNTPLHGAAESSSSDSALLLLAQPGIEAQARNNEGLTPYELALKRGWTKFAELVADLSPPDLE